MTRLEEDMYQALRNAEKEGKFMNVAAAEVAKKYIIEALDDAKHWESHQYNYDHTKFKEQWLKDNGITE